MSENNIKLISLVKFPKILLFAKLKALINIALTQAQTEDWENVKIGLNDVDD
jgi:hypothetical protein